MGGRELCAADVLQTNMKFIRYGSNHLQESFHIGHWDLIDSLETTPPLPQPNRTSQAKVAPKTPLSAPTVPHIPAQGSAKKHHPPAPTGQRIPAQGVTLGMTP